MESTLEEERSLKQQVEENLLQLKKDHSMLEWDHKQAQQKLDELQAQKEKLSEEVTLEVEKHELLKNLPGLQELHLRICMFIGRMGNIVPPNIWHKISLIN